MIEELILQGCLEVAGIDSNGKFLYTFTPKLKELFPELYEEHIHHVNSEIMLLWQLGYVDVDILSNDPVVTLTSKALDQSELAKLSDSQRWSLEELKRLFRPPKI